MSPTKNGFWCALFPWGSGSYVNGTDFTISWLVYKGSFPNGSVSTWNFPSFDSPLGSHVWAYNFVAWGIYAEIPSWYDLARTQVNRLSCTTTYSVTLTGGQNDFDCMFDYPMFINDPITDPNGIQVANQAFELMIYIRCPDFLRSFFDAQPNQGTFTTYNGSVKGVSWTCFLIPTNSPPILAFVRTDNADQWEATLDIRELYNGAIGLGFMKGTEYFTGMALGTEPRYNGGSMTVNTWSITYMGQTWDAATPYH
jgi:hypothetical protein